MSTCLYRSHEPEDPRNLSSMDVEDRQFDDNSEGIDWEEIIATTQDDFLAGRFAFDSADYPDEQTAAAAMMALMDGLLQEVLNGIAAENSLDATRLEGHPTEVRSIYSS